MIYYYYRPRKHIFRLYSETVLIKTTISSLTSQGNTVTPEMLNKKYRHRRDEVNCMPGAKMLGVPTALCPLPSVSRSTAIFFTLLKTNHKTWECTWNK